MSQRNTPILLIALLVLIASAAFLAFGGGDAPVGEPGKTVSGLDSSVSGSVDLNTELETGAELAQEPQRVEAPADLFRQTGVRGRVIDAKTRVPLGGVEVVALRRLPSFERLESRFRGLFKEGLWKSHRDAPEELATTLTAADGSFELFGLPPGRIFLDGRSDAAFVRMPGTVRLARGEVREGVELFSSPGGRVRGRVFAADGAPASGAVVSLRPGLNAFLGQITSRKYRWLETETDAEGRFDLPGVPAGSGYTLSAGHSLMALEERYGLEVKVGQATTVTVRGRAGASIEGHVIDQDGQPVAAANIAMVYLDMSRLLFSADGRDEPVMTDEDGAFRIDRVAQGHIAFVAAAEGLAPSSIEELTVVDGGAYQDVVLSLGEGAMFSGLVVDQDDRPLTGALVEARAAEESGRSFGAEIFKATLKIRNISSETGGDGRFELRGLTGPSLVLQASKPGYVTEIRTGVKLEERDVRIKLTPGATVRGKVTVSPGTPVSRFRVSARSRPIVEAADAGEGASGAPEVDARSSASNGWGRRGRSGEPRTIRLREGAKFGEQGRGEDWQDFQSADGTFTVRGLPPGEITVRVRAEGLRDSSSQKVVVESGEESDPLSFVLDQGIFAQGVVVDAATGIPVPEAMVTAYRAREERRSSSIFQFKVDPEDFDFLGMSSMGQRSTMTGSQGEFEIEALSPGKYRFTARHPDMAKASAKDVEIPEEGDAEIVRIELEWGGAVEGNVTGAGQRPLADALIVAFSISAGAFKSSNTDKQGRYRIEGLTPGQYMVFKSRMEDVSSNVIFDLMGNMRLKTVTVRRGKSVKLDIHDETEDGVRVFGTVYDGGEPVKRAMVSAMSSDKEGIFGIGIRAKPTDVKGDYELAGLKPGTYFFKVARFVGRRDESNFTVEIPDGATEFRLDLIIPDSSISGVVRNANGEPVKGVLVRAGIEEGGLEADGLLGMILKNGVSETRTDAEGRFELPNVSEGTYRLTASGREGRRSETKKYGSVALGGIQVDGRTPVQDIVLLLPLAGSITGTVIDGNGNPLGGAEVHFRDVGRAKEKKTGLMDFFGMQVRPERSGPDGSFKISGVTPGTYRVEAEIEGRSPGIADNVEVSEGLSTDVTLKVVKGATLRLRVTNIDGKRVPPANVSVVNGKGEPVVNNVSVLGVLRNFLGGKDKKDDSGWYTFKGVTPDTYTIIVREKGEPEVRVSRTVRDGEKASWDINLVEELEKAGRDKKK